MQELLLFLQGSSISGDVTIERYMSGEGYIWRYIAPTATNLTVADWQNSFPISGSFTGADPSATGGASLYFYDETAAAGVLQNGWTAYPTTDNTAPLTSGVGYAAAMSETTNPTIIVASGPLNQGTVNFTVTRTGSGGDSGWNLLGNPYPSQINWDVLGGWTKTNLGDTVSVTDDPAGIFRYWNGTTGNFTGDIAIGQGFWIQATSASPALSVNESAKTSNSATFFRRMALDNHLVVSVSNADSSKTDQLFIHFRPEATDDFDPEFDGRKNVNRIFNFYSMLEDDSKMAINTLNKAADEYINKKILLGLDSGSSKIEPGDYKMVFNEINSFKDNGYKFIITDNFTNEKVEFLSDEYTAYTYSFSVSSDPLSYGARRFELEIIQIITGLEEENSSLISIYPNPGPGRFNFKLQSEDEISEAILLDAKGTMVKLINFAAFRGKKSGEMDLGNLRDGLYFIKLDLGGSTVVKKLVIAK